MQRAEVVSGNYGGGLLQLEDAQKCLLRKCNNWHGKLDFLGKNLEEPTESAKAEMMATEYNLRAVQISLISEVVTSYFIMLDMRMRHQISIKTLSVRDSGLQIVQSRFEYGMAPKIDVNQAQIQKSIAEASIPLYKRQLTFTENNLSILLGQNPDDIPVSSTLFEQKMPPPIPAGLPSDLLARRPDLLAAKEDLHASTANIGVAQAMRFSFH